MAPWSLSFDLELNSQYVYLTTSLTDTCAMEETQPATRELPFYLASRKHRFGGSMVGLGIEFTIAMVCATAIVLMTPVFAERN